MGYTTDFRGQFTVTPALDGAQVAYLTKFNQTRRMRRNVVMVESIMADPLREAVGLPVGPDGAYFVGGLGDFGQTKDGSVFDQNRPPEGQPGLWCQWVPTADGTAIEWDEGEKFYEYTEWLQYIAQHFLKPWGRSLSGQVRWGGEDSGDTGTIYAKGLMVEAVPDGAGMPSWETAEPEHQGGSAEAQALDEIHALLSGKEWNSDTLVVIAEILRLNGRPVAEPDEEML